MKNKIYSMLLILVAIIVAYYSANFFGKIYNNLFPTELNSGWIGSRGSLQFLGGISLSLIFFLTFFSYGFIFKSKKSVLYLILPFLLFEMTVDIRHFYIPIILIIIGLLLSWIIRKIFLRHPNPPMVIK